MKVINKVLILSLATLVVGAFSISSSSALFKKNASDTSFGIRQATPTHNVKFYTTFDGSDWGDETTLVINNGNSVSVGDIPSISLSGYSFEGWVNATPTSSNYFSTLSNSNISALSVTSNVSYYPILKSNSKVAYTHSNDNDYYYDLNTDVAISYQTLKATYIGYRYVGITGIPVETSSWVNDRDLVTSSGIYQFSESAGAVVVNRKIGFRVSDSGYWSTESTEYYGLYCFGGSNSASWCSSILTRTDNTQTYIGYYYVDYEYDGFNFVRLSEATASWDKKWNQSSDISLLNNKKYNSEVETSSYTSTNITMDKNNTSWDSWTGCWSNY